MKKIIRNISNSIKKNKTTLFIIGAIVLIFSIINKGTNPQIEIPTQAIFGGAGGFSIAIGAILLIVGIVLALIPGGIVIAPLFMIGAFILAGGAALTSLEMLFTSTQGLLTVGAILLALYFIYK